MEGRKAIEVIFMNKVYGINVETNKGLDDLVYDMKLNQYIDDCYKVVSISDLRELFEDGVLSINTSCGCKKKIF